MFDIYETARNDAWRFRLGRTGQRMLVVVGLNPSTATNVRPDMTLRKIERIAAADGFDGFVVVNLYPARATAVEDLPLRANPRAYARNMGVIEAVVGSQPEPVLWAAWSERIESRAYLLRARDELIARLAPRRVRWVRYGPLTKSGHPRHPSRAPYGLAFEPLDVAG